MAPEPATTGIEVTGDTAVRSGMSLPRRTAALCGAFAILLGLIGVLGWTIHAPVFTQVAPDLPPMHPDTAACLVVMGLALIGVGISKPRLTFIGCAIAATVVAVSLAEYVIHFSFAITGPTAMSPASVLCFMVLAAGLVMAQMSPPLKRSPTLGIAGLLVMAVTAACGISVVWGNGDVFGLGSWSRMGFLTMVGFLPLGIGTAAGALDTSYTGIQLPVWAPIGVGLVMMTVRAGLLQVFSPEHQSSVSSTLAWLGSLGGGVVFGVFVHLALKTRLQREFLRTANLRLAEEMLQRMRAEELVQAANEHLERRVEERMRAVEAVNEELRKEISRRKQVEEDLRRQKEILQSIIDHVPLMLKFVDRQGRLQMVNREWERVLGRTLNEIVNQSVDVYEEGYPDPVERQRVIDFAAKSSGEWADFKTTVKDGRVIDTSWAVARLSDGSTICIGQDITERKQAEQELRKQKELLQTIFDHIPVMIGFVDQKGRPQMVNREWERVLGYTLEEIFSQNIDVIEENYPDLEYREEVRDFVENSDAEWADFKTRVRDGRVIDTSWAMLRLSDGNGIGIGQDITKRKRAEEALRESEERFRQLTENINDLFWIKTPDFKRVLYLSPAYESICGRSLEERYKDLDYQPFLNSIHPDDREKMAQIMQSESQEEFDVEFRIFRSDGAIRWIRDRGFPIRDQSGQIYRVAGIASDITERKLAEEALRESEERFRQLTDNIHEVFWLRSPDFKQLLYVSPRYEQDCGKASEVIYATGVDLDAVHPEDRALVAEKMSLGGQEFEMEYRIITKEGNVRWLRDRGFPIRNQHGEIYRIGGVAEDITERKEAENRLKATSEQLRALSASLQSAREEEAARIAHQIHDDMGGVLTALRWELEALAKMIHEPADTGQLKTAMQNKLATMLGLTDTTINVVRRIASELRPSILDDLGLMEAVEWQAQQFQSRTGIECRCDCARQNIPLGERESTAVFRIFQEALTNILRHAQATRVHVAVKEEDGMFVLTVADNGRGITEVEKLGRDSLGILGMRERAHLFGGEMDLVGESGVGTRLHVRVPIDACAFGAQAGGAN